MGQRRTIAATSLAAVMLLSVVVAAQPRASAWVIDPAFVTHTGPGQLDRQVLLLAIERASERFDACLDRETGEPVHGRVRIELTVTRHGEIENVHATQNGTRRESLAACVVEAARALRLDAPPTDGSITFSVPFDFSVVDHDILAGSGIPAFPPAPLARLLVDEPEIVATGTGVFDTRVVVRMLNTRRSALRACYERALRTQPELPEGRVTVRFTLDVAGTASAVGVVESSFATDTIADCVRRVVEGFRFNPGPAGGSLTYTIPLLFQHVAPDAH